MTTPPCSHPSESVIVTASEAAGKSLGSTMMWNSFRCEVCGRQWRRLEDYALPVGSSLSTLKGPRVADFRREWALDSVPDPASQPARVSRVTRALLRWPGPRVLRWGLPLVILGVVVAVTGCIFGTAWLVTASRTTGFTAISLIAIGYLVMIVGTVAWTAYRARHTAAGVQTSGVRSGREA
jgi:hypothetical protein